MNFDTWFRGELDRLQERLGYCFKDPAKLETALIHSSYAHEKGADDSNQRMEFLGDAALELGVSLFLYRKHPGFDEGDLTRARAAVVCGKSLAEWGEEMNLGRLLRTGHGLRRDQSAAVSLCTDAAEAVFGAVFLDGGFSALMEVIEKYLLFHRVRNPAGSQERDPKSRLQIAAQEKGLSLPVYEMLSVTGPSHSPRFCARVLVDGHEKGTGEGDTRKDAEFAAAEKALSLFGPETCEEA